MKLPLNRVVAFFGPYIAIVAGGVAAWAVAKANVIGIPGLGEHQNELATGLAAGATWALTAGLSWLGQSKWLKGVHISMQSEAVVTAAALAPVNPTDALPIVADGGVLKDPESEAAEGDVSDDEEFASPPPPDDTNTPVQPSQVD